MTSLSSRIPFKKPFRSVRPTTSKIIFLSCEGRITEEEYFKQISRIYDGIKSKVQFISVAEDMSPAELSRNRPKQLVERIDSFKAEKNDLYQFLAHPDDEFWIITDVDQNWSTQIINPRKQKSYLDEWNEAVLECERKKYNCAMSNPFFEVWLLLHHGEPTNEDKEFAVSDTKPYQAREAKNHFRARLNELGAPLIGKKIRQSDYDDTKVRLAVQRARKLHKDPQDPYPKYFATTVYVLLQKILDMLPEDISAGNVTKY